MAEPKTLTIIKDGITRIVTEELFNKKFKAQGYTIVEPKPARRSSEAKAEK